MKLKDEHWVLIAKHLSGETSTKEQAQVETLAKNDDAFFQEMQKSEKLWKELKYEARNFDKAKGYQRVQQKIQRRSLTLSRWFRYAAAIVILSAISWGGYRASFQEIQLTATRGNKAFTLPDGSRLFLKKGADITYTQSIFTGFNRHVNLQKGEAFFAIAKKNGHEFTVNTGDFTVHVLGTKFNIRKDKAQDCIVLSEGRVLLDKITGHPQEQILMSPGKRTTFFAQSQKLITDRVNTEIYTLWMKDKIEFKRFSMQDMQEVFSYYFGKTLLIQNRKALLKHIAGSAPADDYKLIIKGLCEVMDASYTERNDTITIQ